MTQNITFSRAQTRLTRLFLIYQSILKNLDNFISEFALENTYIKNSYNFAQTPFTTPNPTIKIAIIGESSSGKSSFVNALIGQNISPTDVLPNTTRFPIKFTHGDNKLLVIFADDTKKVWKIPEVGNFPVVIANASNLGKVSEIVCFSNNVPGYLDIYDTQAIDGGNCSQLPAIVQKCDIIFITTNLAASPLSYSLAHFTKGLIKNGNIKNIYTGTFADKFNHKELLQINNYMEEKLKNFYEKQQKIIFSALPPNNPPRVILPASGRNISLGAFINECISKRLNENYKILLSAAISLVTELINVKEKLQKHTSLSDVKIQPKLLQDFITRLIGLEENISTHTEIEIEKFHSRLIKRISAYKSWSGIAAFWTEKLPAEFAAFAKDFNIHFAREIKKIYTQNFQGTLMTKNIKYGPDYFPNYINFSFDCAKMEFPQILKNDGDIEKLKDCCISTLQKLLDDFSNPIRKIIKINIEQINIFFENLESSNDTANASEIMKRFPGEEKYARILREALNLQKIIELSLSEATEFVKYTKWAEYNDTAGI